MVPTKTNLIYESVLKRLIYYKKNTLITGLSGAGKTTLVTHFIKNSDND